MKSYIASLIILITFVGCEKNKPIEVPNPVPGIEDVQGGIKKDAKDLAGTTDNIKKEATAGEKKTPDALKPTLNPHWNGILTEATKQEAIVGDLKAKDAELAKIKKETEELKKFAADETARANKAEASLADALTKKLYMLVILGVVGIAVSVGLIFTGSKGGILVGIVSVALIAASLAISTAAKVMEIATPYIVGGIILAAVSYGVWWFIQKKKEAAKLVEENGKLQQSALELVETTEGAKEVMPEAACTKMFGNGALVGMAHVIQSRETRKLVSEMRKKIKLAKPKVNLANLLPPLLK